MNALIVGKIIEVVDSKNNTLVGIKGVVVDETKNSFVIENQSGKKQVRVLKNICTFKLNNQIVDGKDLEKRPYERIK